MNPIEVLYTYEDAKKTIFPVIRDFNDMTGDEKIKIISDYICKICHCSWPYFYNKQMLKDRLEAYLPFNYLKYTDKNIMSSYFDIALNMSALFDDIKIERYYNNENNNDQNDKPFKFIRERRWLQGTEYSFENSCCDSYSANLSSVNYKTYFCIYNYINGNTINLITNVSGLNIDIIINETIDKIIRSDSKYAKANIRSQIVNAFKTYFIKQGYMKDDNINFIDKIYIVKPKNENVDKTTNETIVTNEKSVNEKPVEENSISISNKEILSIADINKDNFSDIVRNATIEVNVATLDYFIYMLESSKYQLSEKELISIVDSVKTKDIKISNKQYLSILIGALFDMEYDTLLAKNINNYKYYMSKLSTTQFVPDSTVYQNINKEYAKYTCEYASDTDTFAKEFYTSFNKNTVFKIFKMDHKEIKSIIDYIVSHTNKDINFFGSKQIITKTNVINKIGSVINDAIKYICKYRISMYKKSMTPYRLRLHIYQLLYFVFKQFIMKYKDEYTRSEIRHVLIDVANEYCSNTTSYYYPKSLMDAVCKYGDVSSEYFNSQFKLSKNVEAYRTQRISNVLLGQSGESRIHLKRSGNNSNNAMLV